MFLAELMSHRVRRRTSQVQAETRALSHAARVHRIDRIMLSDAEADARHGTLTEEQDAYAHYLLPYHTLMMDYMRREEGKRRAGERKAHKAAAAAAVDMEFAFASAEDDAATASRREEGGDLSHGVSGSRCVAANVSVGSGVPSFTVAGAEGAEAGLTELVETNRTPGFSLSPVLEPYQRLSSWGGDSGARLVGVRTPCVNGDGDRQRWRTHRYAADSASASSRSTPLSRRPSVSSGLHTLSSPPLSSPPPLPLLQSEDSPCSTQQRLRRSLPSSDGRGRLPTGPAGVASSTPPFPCQPSLLRPTSSCLQAEEVVRRAQVEATEAYEAMLLGKVRSSLQSRSGTGSPSCFQVDDAI